MFYSVFKTGKKAGDLRCNKKQQQRAGEQFINHKNILL